MKKLINVISDISSFIGNIEEEAKEQFNLLHLTSNQMNYLEVIHQLDNPNITELAQQLKLSKPTVKVVVDKLI